MRKVTVTVKHGDIVARDETGREVLRMTNTATGVWHAGVSHFLVRDTEGWHVWVEGRKVDVPTRKDGVLTLLAVL